jgi:polysaccharide export outer membrane protein
MISNAKMTLKKWFMLLCIPALVACASTTNVGKQSDSVRGSEASDLISASEVRPINLDLIKADKEKRAKLATQDISELFVIGQPHYKIDNGDILSIVVWDHPELAGAVMLGQAQGPTLPNPNLAGLLPAGFVVDHKGVMQFPLIGSVKIAGLTTDEATDLLVEKLAKYIQKPRVTLRIQAYRSKRIYIDGEVKAPGLQPIDDIPMTLVEALNRAGGVLPTADQSRIVVNRGDKSYQINMQQLVQRGINPASIMMMHGDVVRVPSREESKVFVSGEVTTPKSLMMHNGRLTLNEALGEAGGINATTGDGKQVYVVRRSGNEAAVYQLDASAPGALAVAEGFELDPKDVVYVAASSLANWHRNISLLLPGALSGAVGAAKPY